MLQILAKRHF